MRKPLFISLVRGANISSVAARGRASSGGMIATIEPFDASSDLQLDTGAGVATLGFKSACCS